MIHGTRVQDGDKQGVVIASTEAQVLVQHDGDEDPHDAVWRPITELEDLG